MKQPVYFPFYCIYSDIVKTALGLKDTRSIEKFFVEAGVKIHEIGKKKCVTCEDLLGMPQTKLSIMTYKPQSKHSKELFDMFE